MLISTFCYQGLINIFLVLSFLLIILKQEYENIGFKENIYSAFKEILKVIAILLIVMIFNIITIKMGMVKIGDDSKRIIDISNQELLLKRLKEVVIYLDEIWNKSMNMLPKHLNSALVIGTLFMIFAYKKEKKWEFALKYILLISGILTVCIAPMFVFNTGICGRVNVPISEIWGISLILIITFLRGDNADYKCKKQIIYFIIICSFILNSIMILKNTSEHIAANRVDEALGKTIKCAIEKYEEESGLEITKFSYAFDANPQQYSEGIRQIGSLTERKFACPWCVQEAVEFYCGKKFELVKMPLNVYNNFRKDDYTEFLEEQLYFSNNTLYMLIY